VVRDRGVRQPCASILQPNALQEKVLERELEQVLEQVLEQEMGQRRSLGMERHRKSDIVGALHRHCNPDHPASTIHPSCTGGWADG